MNSRSIAPLALIFVLVNLAGCATTNFFKFSKDHFPKTGPKNPVVRILGLWQVAEGLWDGKTMRGFSGQILFFGQESDLPAQVDGDVRIYVFDDQGSADEQALPVRQFDYPASSWNALLAKGPLGATYNLFVPYTRPGIQEAKCTLRIRYTPAGGGMPVYSDMVNVQLPGTKKSKPATDPAAEHVTPEASAETSDGLAGASSREFSTRQPPHARGMAQAIPLSPDLQENRTQRPQPVELTAKERKRILRETGAGRKPADTAAVSLAGYEEPAAEDQSDEQVPASRRSRKSLRFTDDAAAAPADDEAEGEGEAPLPAPADEGLDAQDQELEQPPEEETEPLPESGSEQAASQEAAHEEGSRKRHPLDDD